MFPLACSPWLRVAIAPDGSVTAVRCRVDPAHATALGRARGRRSSDRSLAGVSDRFGTACMAEVDAFVRLVRDGGPNRSPGRGALDAMRVAAAADRSLAEHRPVAVTEIKLSER